jgi:ABC-type uncharacterized transport system permease subunit
MPLISMFLVVKNKIMIKTVAIFGASQAGLAGAVEVLGRTVEPLTLWQLSQFARAARAFVASQPKQKAAACC